MKNKTFFFSGKKAQQLVEFAIVVPILMIILFIIIEFGSALNTRITLAEGVKQALVKVNNLSNLNGDKATKSAFVEDFVKNEIMKYLIQHNIPNSASVNVKVKAVSNYANILVSYQYNPYFIIPGLLGGQLPSSIPFSSSQSLNPHIFENNDFPPAGDPLYRNTFRLGTYHRVASGSFLNTGILVNHDVYRYTSARNRFNSRDNTIFLIHFYGGLGTHPNLEYDYARPVNHQGDDLFPPNLRANMKTGTLEVRSPYYNNGSWFDTRIPYVWVFSAMGINHLIYVKYNSFQMLLADDSNLYYKFRFNDNDPFYNRNIFFCGTTGGGNCNGDLRGTGTVNERAFRMNPRLGLVNSDPDNGNNDYIIGTMEPITIPNDPNHHFQHITSHYFAYPDADSLDSLLTWNSSNWHNQYLLTIASPYVLGHPDRPSDMADEIYHPDINDDDKNPFYSIYEYRLKMVEAPAGGAVGTPGGLGGIFWTVDDGTGDGRLDAHNAVYPFDGIGGVEDPAGDAYHHYYTVDIVDVYIDSDGDGIPDAWDRDPAHFDVNINGILDGNETDSSVFNTNNKRCNDGIGEPLNYLADPAICGHFPDVIHIGDDINGHIVEAANFTQFYASPGKPYYRATPYTTSGVMSPLESHTSIPEIKDMAEWVLYDPPSAGKALYYKVGANYRRIHYTWWQDGIGGCSSPTDKFSLNCVKERRKLKSSITGTNFIQGTPTGAGPDDIELAPSVELQFLRNHVFKTNYRVRRTPPSVW